MVVASLEPASATITSRTIPAVAPGTSAASVGSKVRSAFSVAVTSLSIRSGPASPRIKLYHVDAGGEAQSAEILAEGRVLDLFTILAYIAAMSRAAAPLRRPRPPTAPADPIGETAVPAVRRKGRGAQSNATGRDEPLARVAFDDGWQRLADLPAFTTSVTVDASRPVI